MERNIRHVQRWLERCLEAYRHRRHGVALAELESARAELEIAREMLAEELAGQDHPTGLFLGRFSRVVLTSTVFFFALALPASHRVDQVVASLGDEAPMSGLSLEMVTGEERLLLQNLRRPPALAKGTIAEQSSPVHVVSPLTAKAEEHPDFVIMEEIPVADVPEMPQKKISRPVAGSSPSDKLEKRMVTPSVEEVLSLLQVGQRALQNPEKRIPIQP